MNYLKNLKKIKGDASFRKFYRKRNKNFSSIVVYAKKEKFKNLLVYDAINKILITNKILAPTTYHENYKKNWNRMNQINSDAWDWCSLEQRFLDLEKEENKKKFAIKTIIQKKKN